MNLIGRQTACMNLKVETFERGSKIDMGMIYALKFATVCTGIPYEN